MAYTTTGKPVGRPKTKDYTTISLKMPQDLLDRVQRYAQVHRQSVSTLIREGLAWRITEGDPRGVGEPSPESITCDENMYYRNTEMSNEGHATPEPAGGLQEIRATLARQEALLCALAQTLMPQAVVPMPSEYSGNTSTVPGRQHSAPEPAEERQEVRAASGTGQARKQS
jgi:hypothetical protein